MNFRSRTTPVLALLICQQFAPCFRDGAHDRPRPPLGHLPGVVGNYVLAPVAILAGSIEENPAALPTVGCTDHAQPQEERRQ
jgi:hypothetical protein